MKAQATVCEGVSVCAEVLSAAETAAAPLVALEDLRFAWEPDAPAVIDIGELRVARGERVFVAGPSGCGKSTLLALLTGVATPQHGAVEVSSTRLDRLGGAARDRFRADHVGMIFQQFNLIPYLSVTENVMLPCRFSRQRRARALDRSASVKAEAERLLRRLELGPELACKRVTELSVGQQQRVAAARALMGAPALVIADEPTSSLDADLREAFIDLLFGECAENGTTLVFVSHDVSLATSFDRTIDLPVFNRAGRAGGE